MDPVSAIGLASSALTFVDVAAKCIRGAREIQKSATGATILNENRYVSAGRLFETSKALEQRFNSLGRDLTPEEAEIRATAKACLQWSTSLQDSLPSMDTSNKDRQFLRSVLFAIKSMWNEHKMKEAEHFLEQSRSDLHLQMTKALLTQSSGIQQTVHDLVGMRDKLTANDKQILSSVTDMRKVLLRSLDRINTTPGVLALSEEEFNGAIRSNVERFYSGSEQLLKNAKVRPILRSLWFERITSRRRQVSRKHETTYSWIFDTEHCGKPLGLLDWLQKDDGIYWITGKPGAGKSVLMRTILDDSRTQEALSRWAKEKHGCHVLVADFFFWRPGQYLEKSIEGLIRSLLHSIFSQMPTIIKAVLPERWEEASSGMPMRPWELAELKDALKALNQGGDLGTAFCFLIDGLDEYIESPSDIAEIITSLAKVPKVKLLVSSRPWNEFKYAFGGREVGRLIIHDHTRDDISRYVQAILGQEEGFKARSQEDPRYDDVLRQIVERAEGVFLWVFLICRRLLRSLPNEEPFEVFQTQMNDFPVELEEVFNRILDDIPENFREQSSKIILMYLNSLSIFSGLPLGIIEHLTEPKSDLFKSSVNELSRLGFEKRSHILGVRLEARCRDLLHVVNDYEDVSSFVSGQRIEVLHRSMLDYLESPAIGARIREQASRTFEPELEIYRGLVADWKSVGREGAFLTYQYYYEDGEEDKWLLPAMGTFGTIVRALGHHSSAEALATMRELLRIIKQYPAGWCENKLELQDDLLMSVAVYCRLHEYVQVYMTAEQSSKLHGLPASRAEAVYIETLPLQVPALVFSDLETLDLFITTLDENLPNKGRNTGPSRGVNTADALTLSAILNRGGNVNADVKPNSGMPVTAWEKFLTVVKIIVSEGAVKEERREQELSHQRPLVDVCADMVILFLDHGAPLTGKAVSNSNSSPGQMLESIFAEAPHHVRSFIQVHEAAKGRYAQLEHAPARGKKRFSFRAMFKSKAHS